MSDEDVDININNNLTELEVSNIDVDLNTARIDTSNGNGSSLFAANNLYRETANNLAKAESMVNEIPLRTDKTIELEKKEREDSE